MLIGFSVAGEITQIYSNEAGPQWQQIWLFPAGFAALVLLVFALIFKNETLPVFAKDSSAEAQPQPQSGPVDSKGSV